MSFGVYVHVPFCSALCPYCDFAVVVGNQKNHERYCRALEEEAETNHWRTDADTLFIGGGTPTYVDAKFIGHTIETLFGIFHFGRDAEISIEANPESVSLASMKILRDAGVNRLSIGAQSFDDSVLQGLSRTHSAADVTSAVDVGRAAGCSNISLDLIYGDPGESDSSWERSLRAAIALGVEHVSCYALTIEPATAFGRAVFANKMRAPDDDVLAARYERALDVLGEAGYVQYELSNWAKPGFECKHNLVYWTQGDYLGLGLGAHSHRDGHRWWNTRALNRYLADPANARDGEERLDAPARAEEWLSLRMRLIEGLSIEEAERRMGTLETGDLEATGLVTRDEDRLRLTRRGMLLENEVTARLLQLS